MSRVPSLNKIKMELESLPLAQQRRLVAQMRQALSQKRMKKKRVRDWTELYGLGKGLWRRQDAQTYVNRLREERA